VIIELALDHLLSAIAIAFARCASRQSELMVGLGRRTLDDGKGHE